MSLDLASGDASNGHGISSLLDKVDPVRDFALVWSAGALLGALVAAVLWTQAA